MELYFQMHTGRSSMHLDKQSKVLLRKIVHISRKLATSAYASKKVVRMLMKKIYTAQKMNLSWESANTNHLTKKQACMAPLCQQIFLGYRRWKTKEYLNQKIQKTRKGTQTRWGFFWWERAEWPVWGHSQQGTCRSRPGVPVPATEMEWRVP